jgi:hypothetical protein
MSITAKRFLARSNTTARLLNEAREEIVGDDFMAISDIEEMGQEFAETFDLLERAWPKLRRSFFSGNVDLAFGRKLVAAIDLTIDAVQELFTDADRANADRANADRANADRANPGGFPTDGLSNLKKTVAAARAIREEAADFWPAADLRTARINAARAEFERGEYTNLSELSGDAQAGLASDN